jgi:glycosyltransferase involved in cell wall biosynthesis
MKILFVLGSFYPAQSGGPNNSVYWISKELCKNKIDVSVISLKDGLSKNDIKEFNLKINKQNVIDGIKAMYFGYTINRYFSLRMHIWMFKNIKNFDLVNLNSVFFPYTWIASFLCIIFKVPFIIAPRGELEPGAIQYRKKFKTILLNLFIIKLLSSAKILLVTSAQEKFFSERFFEKNICKFIFPNFIELKKSFLSKDDILLKKGILFIGRLHPKKGIENLIGAYDLIYKKGRNDITLTIAGKGNIKYEEELKNKVSLLESGVNIKFIGHITGDKKNEILTASKVMVMPSYSENFGNVVLEALSAYTPVIASKFTPWSILEEAKCGYCQDNTAEVISKSLLDILDKKDIDYLEMAYNSRRLVEEKFDVKKNSRKLVKKYKSILGK